MNRLSQIEQKRRERKLRRKKKKKALSKPDVFRQFVEWMSLPLPLREPKTQEAFRKKWGVTRATLTGWKKREEFWKAVEEEWKTWGRERTADVIESFHKKILDEGFTADYKLWFQFFLNWNEKTETEHTGEIEIIHTYPNEKKNRSKPQQKDV